MRIPAKIRSFSRRGSGRNFLQEVPPHSYHFESEFVLSVSGCSGIQLMDLTDKRILIVKPSSLGDVVHTLPLVHALKRNHPSCFIGWIVQKSFQGILQSDPSIDEIIPIYIPSTSDPHAARGAVVRATSATLATLRRLRSRFKVRPYDLGTQTSTPPSGADFWV